MNVDDLIRFESEPGWFDKSQWFLGIVCLEDGDTHPTLHVRTPDDIHPWPSGLVTARFIHQAARDCELLAVWTERVVGGVQYQHGPPPSFGGIWREDQPTADTRMKAGYRLVVDRPVSWEMCR